jgi:hypothetical protein
MTQIASTSDKAATRSGTQPLVPPDESMWKRYSPHGELPLSGASSLALHLLIFGLMLLSAWLAYAYFRHANRSLPVEAVRLDLGGGGGDPHARGTGPGRGEQPVEVGAPTPETPLTPNPDNDPKRPDLPKTDPGARQPFKFDDTAIRYIHRSDTASSAALQKLAEANIRIRLPDGREAGRGQGGTGSGGGSGSGEGTGVGSGKGEGGTLTQREKRMLRWSMIFNTNSGPDYVSQLQGLGAILAIPVREDASGREYKTIRNLSARPAKLLTEDISQIPRIYWIDDKAQSVQDVLRTLGVQLKRAPSHFVAFMPEELEHKLFQLEAAYLNQHYKGRSEDDIVETRFRINRTGGNYEPQVTELKVK